MNSVDNFDNMIRVKAKSELIFPPNDFEERNDNLIENLVLNSSKPIRVTRSFRHKTAVLLFIIFTLGSVTVAAQCLTGGDFFAWFFIDKANNDTVNDYGYMNTEQLGSMATSTIGTVVDTGEITVDVLGVIKSGNTANIMIKVTANKLDSVLYDNGIEPLKNYRFNDETMGSLSESCDQMSFRYIFSDEDKELEVNQFKILYTAIGTDKFDDIEYTINLNNFGYFTFGKENLTDFVSIYDDNWKFEISLDSNSDSCKTIFLNKQITIDNVSITVDSIKITALSCTVNFKTNTEYSNEFFNEFSEGIADFTIKLDDEIVLDRDQFEYSGTGKSGKLQAHLIFTAPISVNDVTSISLFGARYDLK